MSGSKRKPSRSAGSREGSAGQALAEFAIILVVLMLLILGIVDLSRAVFIQSAVANAAREGARYAVVHPGVPKAELEAQVDERAMALLAGFAGAVDVEMRQPDADHVEVTVTHTFYPATGLVARAAGIGSGGLLLRGSSTMRVEAQ